MFRVRRRPLHALLLCLAGAAGSFPCLAQQADAPIRFSAKDSLIISFRDGNDVGNLYNYAKIAYKEAELYAFRIDMLFDQEELRASGLQSDSGAVGRPSFTQGEETFEGAEIAFNAATERGRVTGARTTLDEGFIRADVVKVGEDSTLYIAEGAYTTCECLDDPSYSLRSDKMKVVNQEWIYTGPIRLYLFNIPTPLWLPFGFVPAQEGRRSGPLPPRYGEDERGFYLRNWGWYQAINDYMDAQLEFGLWTRGSFQVTPQFRYAKRYRYSGQIVVDYLQNRNGEKGDPDFSEFGTGRLRWTHNQELSPTARLRANIDLSSSSYLRTSSEQYDDRVRQTVQSSAGFSKTWRNAGRNLSLNLSHQQNLDNGSVRVVLPSLTFRQNTRKPFARAQGGGRDRWYERITYDYSLNADNRYNFVPNESTDIAWYEALVSPSKYREATGGSEPFAFKAAHRMNIGAGLPALSRTLPIHIVPNIRYTEDWFIQTERRRLDDEGRLAVEKTPDFLALRQFSTGVSANTTFYGIFPFRIGPLDGLRHTVRPSTSFSYQPDFYADAWGYTASYTDANGANQRYALVPGVQRSGQKSMRFSVDNVFETRYVSADSAGAEQRKVVQLLNMGLATGYNFAADSMKLGDLRMNARTRIARNLSLNAGATFSPYALNAERTRVVSQSLFSERPWFPLRTTSFRASLNTSFQSKQTGPARPFNQLRSRNLPAGANIPGGGLPIGNGAFGSPYSGAADSYADFAIPWSLRLDFSYNYAKPLGESRRTAAVNANVDFNLTPNWKVQGRSGYDFEAKKLIYTSLSVFRDFDCWEMAINWVPFGPYQSYSFDLHVKSGQLRDLLRLRQPRSDVRGRFGRLRN